MDEEIRQTEAVREVWPPPLLYRLPNTPKKRSGLGSMLGPVVSLTALGPALMNCFLYGFRATVLANLAYILFLSAGLLYALPKTKWR